MLENTVVGELNGVCYLLKSQLDSLTERAKRIQLEREKDMSEKTNKEMAEEHQRVYGNKLKIHARHIKNLKDELIGCHQSWAKEQHEAYKKARRKDIVAVLMKIVGKLKRIVNCNEINGLVDAVLMSMDTLEELNPLNTENVVTVAEVDDEIFTSWIYSLLHSMQLVIDYLHREGENLCSGDTA